MQTIYQRANCDTDGHITYLGCLYKNLYELEQSIHDRIEQIRAVDCPLSEQIEDVRGSWPAKIEVEDYLVCKTTFFPLIAFRRPYDHKEFTLGYIEHYLY